MSHNDSWELRAAQDEVDRLRSQLQQERDERREEFEARRQEMQEMFRAREMEAETFVDGLTRGIERMRREAETDEAVSRAMWNEFSDQLTEEQKAKGWQPDTFWPKLIADYELALEVYRAEREKSAARIADLEAQLAAEQQLLLDTVCNRLIEAGVEDGIGMAFHHNDPSYFVRW